ncbi:MAG: hydrolase, partial [Firmicutes bacterium]|nr:hydrolase [Bacillota bacterium]
MKFVTFAAGGRERVGIWLEAGILPLPDQDGYRFETMLDLIENMQIEWMEELEQSLANRDYSCLSVEDVLWRAPITFPRRNVFCLGKNYAEHVREIKIAQIADT